MYYAVSVLMLGYTRTSGVVAYNSETRAFEEITPAVARRMIEAKQIKGILWKPDEDGGLFIPDADGFNQQNILVKTAVGKFRPLLNDHVGVQINSQFTVVRKILTDYRGTLYEVVSNKAARVKITEQQLKELNNITEVSGVWFTEKGIELCDGIPVEDRTANSKESAVEVKIETLEKEQPEIKKEEESEEKEPKTMTELFETDTKAMQEVEKAASKVDVPANKKNDRKTNTKKK